MNKVTGFIFEIFYQVVLALAIFMLIYFFLLQPHQVKGHSMDPNFQNGEYILTDKFSYKIHEPKRGDVVIFAAPPDKREDFIKRIIALGGDTISLKNGVVYLNGIEFDEDYIPITFKTYGKQALKEGESLTIGPSEYFVMGDNRENSSDSRAWGVIKKSDIVGRAWVVYWPPNRVRVIPGITYADI